jgi:hypothetical protein
MPTKDCSRKWGRCDACSVSFAPIFRHMVVHGKPSFAVVVQKLCRDCFGSEVMHRENHAVQVRSPGLGEEYRGAFWKAMMASDLIPEEVREKLEELSVPDRASFP